MKIFNGETVVDPSSILNEEIRGIVLRNFNEAIDQKDSEDFPNAFGSYLNNALDDINRDQEKFELVLAWWRVAKKRYENGNVRVHACGYSTVDFDDIPLNIEPQNLTEEYESKTESKYDGSVTFTFRGIDYRPTLQDAIDWKLRDDTDLLYHIDQQTGELKRNMMFWEHRFQLRDSSVGFEFFTLKTIIENHFEFLLSVGEWGIVPTIQPEEWI